MCHDTLSPTVPPARLMRFVGDFREHCAQQTGAQLDELDLSARVLTRLREAQGEDASAEVAEPVTGFTKCPVCTCTLSDASRLPCSGCAS